LRKGIDKEKWKGGERRTHCRRKLPFVPKKERMRELCPKGKKLFRSRYSNVKLVKGWGGRKFRLVDQQQVSSRQGLQLVLDALRKES